jgi:hypothetical protein
MQTLNARNQQILKHANAALIGDITDVILDAYTNTDLKMDKLIVDCMLRIQKEQEELRKAVGVSRKGSFTKEIADRTVLIKSRFVGLKYFLKAYQHHPKKEYTEKAKVLWQILRHIGSDLNKKGYRKMNYSLNQLFNEVYSHEHLAKLNELSGLKDCMDELKTLSGELNELIAASALERTQRNDRKQATAVARKIQNLFNEELIPYINVMRKSRPEQHESFARLVNMQVAEINTKIRARRTNWKRNKD